MKPQVTKADERGAVETDWLKARHYFSFGSYFNPDRMGFGKLKVINDDCIAKGSGFATHPHNDMEIITIPLQSSVAHKDSMGNEGLISSGEVQVMSAGSGVRHSEHNASKDEELKLFQIWIEPNRNNVEPRYEQQKFDFSQHNKWIQLVSPIGLREQGLKVHQDAFINRGLFDSNQEAVYDLKDPENGLYVLVVSGSIEIDGFTIKARDSVSIIDVANLEFTIKEKSDVLMIEVPLD